MEFFEVLRKRQSIRKFSERNIEDEKIKKIIDVAHRAPSAGNLQSYEIVIIKKQEKKQMLAEAALGQSFISEAPVVFVVCANEKRSSPYGKRGKELYCINDASIAAAYIELAAAALGLGSVWVGAFDDEAVRKIINALQWIKPIAIIPIGYAAEKPFRTSRVSRLHEEEIK